MLAGRRGGGAAALLVVLVAVLLLGEEPGDRGGGGSAADGGTTAASEPAAGERRRGEVRRVVDGDTIEVALGGEAVDVRYIGVDTPETVKPDSPVECYGPEASAHNKDLVEGERVRLEVGAEPTDAYGRLLAYVFVGETFVNAELIEGGYARTLEIPPNTDRAEELARLERAASQAGDGLWGAC